MKALVFLLLSLPLLAADYKAGFGRMDITPAQPIYLSGYAARKKPSEGVLQKIWAKALAIEDNKGNRVVIVTTDLIGLPRPLADQIGAEVEKRYRLRRSQLLLNSSHTHSGPVVRDNLMTMFDLTVDQRRAITDYTQTLAKQIADVVGAALGNMQVARLDLGHGTGSFAVNRRVLTPTGVKGGVNPAGPVDQDVPVLRVAGVNGQLLGVLFGYACHNTTLGGDLYKVNGDYAGFAQANFEAAHPNATAMFMLLCGADANPNPRGTVALAEQHGASLAKEVTRVLAGKLTPVTGQLRSAFQTAELAFAPHTRETFEAESKESNWFKQQRAAEMLAAYDRRAPVRAIPYPVQGIRLGKSLTLVALGGEVVVDYNLRLKREFPGEELIVAGYSNDVMCYIPSLRVLKEGGYEANDSMIYYGQPGPFAEDVEDRVMQMIYKVMDRIGRKR
ncbi:MAG: neutral/alkaline non-lysosomal ceramidase N-terminal domain-containing protein [Acidobacteriaceae bacterium]|nr:neutral/alkaline non-lysosomal ceramidase N-terminal domain-containing protein [Acidobacteriaceae bacterium]